MNSSVLAFFLPAARPKQISMNLQHKAANTCFTFFVAVKAAWANIPYLTLLSEAGKEGEGQRVAEREKEREQEGKKEKKGERDREREERGRQTGRESGGERNRRQKQRKVVR